MRNITQADYNRLLGEVQQLEQAVNVSTRCLNKREENLNKKQFLCMNSNPNQGIFLPPGDITRVNDTVWPFVFGTGRVNVNAGATVPSTISINQDGAFVIVEYVKTVYAITTGPLNINYLDPEMPNQAGLADGLTFQFRDAQSQRQFMDKPMSINHVGNPLYPTRFVRPMILNPNAIFEIDITNSSTNNYVVMFGFNGYRLRLDNITRSGYDDGSLSYPSGGGGGSSNGNGDWLSND